MDSTTSPDDCERYQDTLYSALAHPHRRTVLRYLLRHPGPVPVSDLASEIELVEGRAPTVDPTPSTAGVSRATEEASTPTGADESPTTVDLSRTTAGVSTATGRSSSFLGLYHVHLPKLLDAGLVELDPATATVSLSRQAAEIPLDSTLRHGLLGLPGTPGLDSE